MSLSQGRRSGLPYRLALTVILFGLTRRAEMSVCISGSRFDFDARYLAYHPMHGASG